MTTPFSIELRIPPFAYGADDGAVRHTEEPPADDVALGHRGDTLGRADDPPLAAPGRLEHELDLGRVPVRLGGRFQGGLRSVLPGVAEQQHAEHAGASRAGPRRRRSTSSRRGSRPR